MRYFRHKLQSATSITIENSWHICRVTQNTIIYRSYEQLYRRFRYLQKIILHPIRAVHIDMVWSVPDFNIIYRLFAQADPVVGKTPLY